MQRLSPDVILFQLNFARDMYRLEYMNYWQRLNLDIVIGPVQPQTAAQLGTSKYWGYTSVCKQDLTAQTSGRQVAYTVLGFSQYSRMACGGISYWLDGRFSVRSEASQLPSCQ